MKNSLLQGMFVTAIAFSNSATAGIIATNQTYNLSATKFWTTNYDNGKADFDVAGKAYAGNADRGHYRFFEKFLLPEYEAGSVLTSAVLTFTPFGSGRGLGLQVFGTSADWTNRNTYYRQPIVTTDILSSLKYNVANNTYTADVTDYLNAVRPATREVSFLIKSGRENTNWVDFTNFMSFGLNVSVQPSSPPNPGTQIPEPSTIALTLAGLGLITWLRSRRA
ncbi:PEP-CTERM sorting domain-containing protein [Massilia sp. erpn]|nr:PEP-CTERM sorting domain-containing protein [Massilia sp. erpn]